MNIPRPVACFQHKLPTGVQLLPDYLWFSLLFSFDFRQLLAAFCWPLCGFWNLRSALCAFLLPALVCTFVCLQLTSYECKVHFHRLYIIMDVSNVFIMLSMHYCYCVVEMGVFFRNHLWGMSLTIFLSQFSHSSNYVNSNTCVGSAPLMTPYSNLFSLKLICVSLPIKAITYS